MLNWTHDPQYCALHAKGECDETTECTGFPTVHDRVNHAQAAYEAYSEADGNSMEDFVADVLLFACINDVEYGTPSLREAEGYRVEAEIAAALPERKPHAEDKAPF